MNMELLKESNLNEPAATKAQLNELKGWMIGVMVVLAILVVTLVLQYFTATQATFQDLKDQVIIQNAKIDILAKEISNLQK